MATVRVAAWLLQFGCNLALHAESYRRRTRRYDSCVKDVSFDGWLCR